MDSLRYTYENGGLSNKLMNVIDRANDVDTKLGDFRSSTLYMMALSNNKTTAATDYRYDDNGNLVKDKNKDIETYAGTDGIEYNYLNLPKKITVKASGSTNKGTIEYIYDATGNKLKKTTTEGSTVTTTLYMYGNYVNDELQFLPHEEGRIRYNTDSARWDYDYMLKDHLGNVRMVLTEEQKTDFYPAASMEGEVSGIEEAIYGRIPDTRYSIENIGGYPEDSYTDPNSYVARLIAENQKLGPNITLKVMAGDEVDIRVSSWYRANNTSGTPEYILDDLISSLSGGVAGLSGGKATQTAIAGNAGIVNDLVDFVSNQSEEFSGDKPMASVNWILFDEQFMMVASSSGYEQVGDDNEFKVHTPQVAIDKNGYLFVYLSNYSETQPVYFDNLQVSHVRGRILEETHYYPYGIMMAGISSKALNFGSPANKMNKFQNQEYNDDLGINGYEFKYRVDDPQLGRFWQVDPLADKYVYNSTYAFSENQIVAHVELEGKEKKLVTSFPSDRVERMKKYFADNATKHADGKADDCITCHDNAMRIITDNPTLKTGSTASETRELMQKQGYATSAKEFGFKNEKGENANSAPQAASLTESVGSYAKVLAMDLKPGTSAVFGISIMDGYHTMTLSISNNYVSENAKYLGTYINITLSDQGSFSGTMGKGNSDIASFDALDNVLVSYVKSQSTAKTNDGSSYPAKIEVHQILAEKQYR
jgi:RHS repeat-associated protein